MLTEYRAGGASTRCSTTWRSRNRCTAKSSRDARAAAVGGAPRGRARPVDAARRLAGRAQHRAGAPERGRRRGARRDPGDLVGYAAAMAARAAWAHADDEADLAGKVRFDAFLRTSADAQDLVARVHDRLADAGLRAFIDRENLETLPELCNHVREAARLVLFLSPRIFESPWCMLEVCEAVRTGVEVVPVVVDGTTWRGGPFPDVDRDVPDEWVVEGTRVRPRAACRSRSRTRSASSIRARTSAVRGQARRARRRRRRDRRRQATGAPPAEP